MRGRRGSRAAAVTLAAALSLVGVSGCSSHSTTVSLAPLAPGTDVAEHTQAYPHTRLGAGTFVRAFFREIDRAMATGSTTRMVALGTASCEACHRMADFITATHDRRQTILGGRLTVRSAVAAPPTGDRVRVTAIVDESPERIVDAGGQVLEHYGASTGVDNEIELVWDGGWHVDRVTLFKE